MNLFKRLKQWVFLSEPLSDVTQIADLLEATITDLLIVAKERESFHLILDEQKQFINAWIGNNYCPASFKIVILLKHCNGAQNFVNYVRFQLRKAGVEC